MDSQVFERVLEISRRMAETRTLQPLLEYAMREAVSLAGAIYGYLLLRLEDGSFDVRVSCGPADETLTPESAEFSHSIIDQVLSTGEPVVLRDATGDEAFRNSKSVTAFKLRSVMCVPLTSRGERIGAVFLENRTMKGRFTDENLTPLMLFANQAAIAIENAMLNDELEMRVQQRTQELEAAKDSIEYSWKETIESNHVRTVLLSNIAHDLRSPLSIAIGSISLVREGTFGELNADQIEWLDRANKVTKQALNLTNDVFELTKSEMGELKLNKEWTDTKDFLYGVGNIAKAMAWAPAVSFVTDVDDALPNIYIDPARIQQVIINLLSNAMKVTEEGSVTLYAHVIDDNRNILIGVRDTGVGIAQEQLAQLFQRFQQIQNKYRRGGTGLGLSICRDLVERHNGSIGVDSELGVGSDFMFTLPIESIEPTAESKSANNTFIDDLE